MPLWGNIDYPSGNQKPLFANTSNVSSNSTINDTAANTDQYYGLVMGVSPTEMTTAEGQPYRPQSSGWVSLKIGTGPITTVSISDPGSGIKIGRASCRRVLFRSITHRNDHRGRPTLSSTIFRMGKS